MAPSSPDAVASMDRWYLRNVVDGGRNENTLQGKHRELRRMTEETGRSHNAAATPALTRIKRLYKKCLEIQSDS